MHSAVITTELRYPAMPLARQLEHKRFVHPGPLVLRTGPLKSPAPTTDRDRTVSRRSEPSSRTALICEQPNPWVDLPPFLTQPVKTQNPFKGELSHGIVEKDVHEGVQAGRGPAAGAREFARRGRAGAGSEPERAAPLAA